MIGISGKIGTGKTTIATHLAEQGWHMAAFADPLKDECAGVFGFPREWCDDPVKKTWKVSTMGVYHAGHRVFMAPDISMSVRQILQWWGTEVWRNQIDANRWVNMAMERVDPHVHTVFHDVRMPNEAGAIVDAGGRVYRIEPYDGWEPGPWANHDSETALDGWGGFHATYRPGYGKLREFAKFLA